MQPTSAAYARILMQINAGAAINTLRQHVVYTLFRRGLLAVGREVLPVFSTKAKAQEYLVHVGVLGARVVELPAMEVAEVMWFGNTYFGVSMYAPDGEWANARPCREFIEEQGFAAYGE